MLYTINPEAVRAAFMKAFAAEKEKIIREETEKAQDEVSRRLVEFATSMALNIHTGFNLIKDKHEVDVIFHVRDKA